MDVLVPILGESVVEATVSKWIKKQGDFVEIFCKANVKSLSNPGSKIDPILFPASFSKKFT